MKKFLISFACASTALAADLTVPPNANIEGEDPNNYTILQENSGVGGYGTFTGTFEVQKQMLITPQTADQPLVFSGVISGPEGVQVQATGEKPVVFQAANTFEGDLHLNGAWLRIEEAGALGAPEGGVNFEDWAGTVSRLDLNGLKVAGKSLANLFPASQIFNSSVEPAEWTGPVRTWQVLRLSGTGRGDLRISGIISEAGGLVVDEFGGGRVILSGDNSLSGTVSISNARLVIDHARALGSASAGVLVPPSAEWAALDLNGQSIAAEPLTVQSVCNLENDAAAPASWGGPLVLGYLIVRNTGGDLTILGNITGTGTIDKQEAGTLILAGTNSYTGPTLIHAGALRINGNSAGATGEVTVFPDATLGGSGAVGGPVTVSGILSPGDKSPGTLTFHSNLTLEPSATTAIHVVSLAPGAYDAVKAAGSPATVTFGGTLEVAFPAGFSTAGRVKIFDFHKTAGKFQNVRFSGLAPGWRASFDSGILTVQR